jgi:hypothetical protein
LPASATPSLAVVSASQWGPDLAGEEHVVGQLVNNGPGVASDVEVDLNFYNSANQLLGTDFTYATVNNLNPGERSPFEDIFTAPAGYNHASITYVTSSPYTSAPNHYFTTTVTNSYRDSIGDTHIIGTVRNNNTTTAQNVDLVFTFLNGTGRTVATDFTYVNTPSFGLAAGQTASFEEIALTDDPTFPAFTSYAILTESSSPPSPAPPSMFKLRPGAAVDISVGANGSVWALGTSPVNGGYGTYLWNGHGWTPVRGAGVRIAVDRSGNPWLVNSAHQIYHWNGSAWGRQPGAAVDISVGANGSVWALGTSPVNGGYGTYLWNGHGWAPVRGAGVRVAVDRSGNPWLVNSAHQIYHWNGSAWGGQPGAAVDISAGANGSVWALGTSPVSGGYGTYHWNGHGWTPVLGGGVRIAVAPAGNPWLVNSAHQIYSS